MWASENRSKMNKYEGKLMRKARVVCFEGTEGVFKTTNVNALASYLSDKGFKVLVTKEPGTPHLPVTMELRRIMLDKAYDSSLTRQARELISQAIRSIHVEKLIIPSNKEYDFIIQDRGVLSGLAYGMSCGNSLADLVQLSEYIMPDKVDTDHPAHLYDNVVYLTRDVGDGLEVAIASKKEFEAGDVIEAKGINFMEETKRKFDEMLQTANNVIAVDVSGKNKEQVLQEIIGKLGV